LAYTVSALFLFLEVISKWNKQKAKMAPVIRPCPEGRLTGARAAPIRPTALSAGAMVQNVCEAASGKFKQRRAM
jgi:hypothetical protein